MNSLKQASNYRKRTSLVQMGPLDMFILHYSNNPHFSHYRSCLPSQRPVACPGVKTAFGSSTPTSWPNCWTMEANRRGKLCCRRLPIQAWKCSSGWSCKTCTAWKRNRPRNDSGWMWSCSLISSSIGKSSYFINFKSSVNNDVTMFLCIWIHTSLLSW